MTTAVFSSPGSIPRKPLAACMASLFVLSAPAAMAATSWPVGNCNDSGAGSLRAVITAGTTLSGDTVDMTGLGCSTSSLTTGAISVTQASLNINGPGMTKLTVTGKNETDRIFKHTGTGTLAIYNLAVSYGSLTAASGTAAGGCIYLGRNRVP